MRTFYLEQACQNLYQKYGSQHWFGNMVAGRKYNQLFVKPGSGLGWASNFQLQQNIFNRQRLWSDGILISQHRQALYVVGNPKGNR